MTSLEKKTLDYWSMSLQYNGRGYRMWTTERAIRALRGIVTTTSSQRPLMKLVEPMYAAVITGDTNAAVKP